MIHLALFLKRTGYRPDKVQDFIPGPMDIATCMYYTGLDPLSGCEKIGTGSVPTRTNPVEMASAEVPVPIFSPVYVPRGPRERRLQRALLQYFKPENYADVREALTESGRPDLIGDGPECLISSKPPKVIEKAKRSPRHPANRKPATGYRPHRKTTKRKKMP
jgi:radical SAM superfamily enzyme YgiQ (UPF0313 family)